MNKTTSSSSGIGFTGLLTIAFIVLKLIKIIDWSWWWILSPIWISVSLIIGVLFLVLITYIIKEVVKNKKEKGLQKKEKGFTEPKEDERDFPYEKS